MLKIRLRRVGAKKQPSYRVVVADSRSPRDGRFVETVGFYNPRTEPPTVEIKEDRVLYWLSQGAQPTEAVAGFLRRLGSLERLARLKSGESLDVLLEEAAAARQQLAEEAPISEEQAEAEQITEVPELEVAEAEIDSEELATADSAVDAEASQDVVEAEEINETVEEEG
jgi:small subunit ribosomal protein S16